MEEKQLINGHSEKRAKRKAPHVFSGDALAYENQFDNPEQCDSTGHPQKNEGIGFKVLRHDAFGHDMIDPVEGVDHKKCEMCAKKCRHKKRESRYRNSLKCIQSFRITCV